MKIRETESKRDEVLQLIFYALCAICLGLLVINGYLFRENFHIEEKILRILELM